LSSQKLQPELEVVDEPKVDEPEPEVEEPLIETCVDLPAEPTMKILSFFVSYDVFLIPEVV